MLIAPFVADDDSRGPPRRSASNTQRAAAVESPDRAMPIAFVGTYGPRRCGIATFTADLAAAIAGERPAAPMVLAVTEPLGEYQYPAEVKFEIGGQG